MSEPPTFVVFADDWGRHPSSCQHLFRHLAQDHRTHWINTIGTRTPRLDLATLGRAWEKVRHWTRKRSQERAPRAVQPPLLSVSSPLMWPWFTRAFDRRINRRLLARHLRSLRLERATVVTTIPLVADLFSLFPDWHWVYYCVDDFSVWPGLDQKPLESMERALVRDCATVVAVSETLRLRLERMGRAAHLLTHGVDLDPWAHCAGVAGLPQLQPLARPLIVFWGVIDQRMDVEWVKRLAEQLDQGTVVLAGPLDNPNRELFQLKNLVHLPPLPFEQLPRLAHDAGVLVMPYADLPVTRAMQPLKLKEYLATGKPVVVRDLPANRDWADCMDLAATPDAFLQAVHVRLRDGVPALQRQARSRLQAESWAGKARQFATWIQAVQSTS